MSQESQGLLSPFLKKQRYLSAIKYIPKGSIMLDIGCGGGDFQQFLPTGVKYFGVDAKKQWNNHAKNLFVSQIGNKYPSQIICRKFDVITALAVVEHLKNPEMLFADAAKLLKNNGILIITTPHPIGRFIHELGAKFGLFSSDASEEHEQFFNKKSLNLLAKKNGGVQKIFKSFLFGINQIAVFSINSKNI